jgi:transposase
MGEIFRVDTLLYNLPQFENQLEETHMSLHPSQDDQTGANPVDPEVLAKPIRRRFTAQYKLSILKEVERCTELGSIGALLRREGLYSSHLAKWRRQLESGALSALGGQKRGPQPKAVNPLKKEVKRLERENRALARKLNQAELVIDFQKKFAEMLDEAKKNEDEQ